MTLHYLQINLNNSKLAQDNCMQMCKKWKINILIVSEPNFISNNWYTDKTRKAAIFIDNRKIISNRLMAQEDGFVAVMINKIIVISCYFSPNDNLEKLKTQMQNLNNFIFLYKNEHILLSGDFNANLTSWGSNRSTNRGYILLDVMSILDMRLANIGNIPTCIRAQGTSVVDLTWSTFSLIPYICNWKVLDNIDDDSLSDHRFIRYDIKDFNDRGIIDPEKYNCKRWNMNKFNVDMFLAFIEGLVWLDINNDNNNDGNLDIKEEATRITKLIKQACNAAAPCIKRRNLKNVYWWNSFISEKRKKFIKLKRYLLGMIKKKNVPERDMILIRQEYRTARLALKKEISKAKINAWKELLDELNKDP